MTSNVTLSLEQINKKLIFYKKEKRMQGFMLHKARVQFQQMKRAVRLLRLGAPPSDEDRKHLEVL